MLDDEDTTITAGSIVTVSVRLVRKSMEDLLGNESTLQNDGTEHKGIDDDGQYQDEDQEDQEVSKRIM